jgi:hypothetical protein
VLTLEVSSAVLVASKVQMIVQVLPRQNSLPSHFLRFSRPSLSINLKMSLSKLFDSFAQTSGEILRIHLDKDIVPGEYPLLSLERTGGQYETWLGTVLVKGQERKYFLPNAVKCHLERTFVKRIKQFKADGFILVHSVDASGCKATIRPGEATLRKHMRLDLRQQVCSKLFLLDDPI